MKNNTFTKSKAKNEMIELIKFIGLIIGVYIVITLAFSYLPFLNSLHTFAIQTNSMEPVINVDDIVVVKEVKPEDVKVGDIMAFRVDITNDGIDDVVVHYIAEIENHGDHYTFRSKPEVSDSLDRWTLEETDLVGVYQFKLIGIGKIILFSQSWIGKAVILFDIILISLLYDLIIGKDENKKKKKTSPNVSTKIKNILLSITSKNIQKRKYKKDKRVRLSMTVQLHKVRWLNKKRRPQQMNLTDIQNTPRNRRTHKTFKPSKRLRKSIK